MSTEQETQSVPENIQIFDLIVEFSVSTRTQMQGDQLIELIWEYIEEQCAKRNISIPDSEWEMFTPDTVLKAFLEARN